MTREHATATAQGPCRPTPRMSAAMSAKIDTSIAEANTSEAIAWRDYLQWLATAPPEARIAAARANLYTSTPTDDCVHLRRSAQAYLEHLVATP